MLRPLGSFAAQATDLMSVIFLLISASTFVAGIFLVAFVWAIRSGQYEDDRSPAVRLFSDDNIQPPIT